MTNIVRRLDDLKSGADGTSLLSRAHNDLSGAERPHWAQCSRQEVTAKTKSTRCLTSRRFAPGYSSYRGAMTMTR